MVSRSFAIIEEIEDYQNGKTMRMEECRYKIDLFLSYVCLTEVSLK